MSESTGQESTAKVCMSFIALAAALALFPGAPANSAPPSRSGPPAVIARPLAAKVTNAIKAIRTRVAHHPGLGTVVLIVRNSKTINVTCTKTNPIVCSPSGPNAVLNVAALQRALANYSVTINTGGSPGSIEIASYLTWASASSLVLDAYNSIIVDARVTVTGPGGLTITTGDGDGSKPTDILSICHKCNIAFWDTANALVINGITYTLLNSVHNNQNTLANLAAAIVPPYYNGNFAFGAPYNAANDSVYQGGVVFAFAGDFTALGNAISNLKANNAGLFQNVLGGATIANVNLINATITGSGTYLGAMADQAISSAKFIDDSVSGSVSLSLSGSCSTGSYYAGGLVAFAALSTVVASASSASVSASDTGCTSGRDQVEIGGLGGGFVNAAIYDSSASGAVTFNGYSGSQLTPGTANVGGLLGLSFTSVILASHSVADVTATGTYIAAGGLVGETSGTGEIELSYATGNMIVNATESGSGGGLVGMSDASGSTDCGATIALCQVFASGNVSVELANGGFGLSAGGLIGYASSSNAQYVYAIGSASSYGPPAPLNGTGGLFGSAYNLTLNQSYSIGAVVPGTSCVGGLIGYVNNIDAVSSYWDTQTSGMSNGVGCITDLQGTITGLTNPQFLSGLPQGFDSNWAESPNFDNGFPYLVNNPPP
jgi:hypothetical protein